MTDTIQLGKEAQKRLHDNLWDKYYQASLSDLMAQLIAVEPDDIERIVELKRTIKFIQGYRVWLVGTERGGEWDQRKLKSG